MKGMDLVDRIELGRFVGRELLLWLWLESELFEATLSTKEHGSFGLWLEGRLSLSEGKETTAIKGTTPGNHREAKESLLRGKMPDRAGLHLSFGDHECTLVLRGDTLAVAGLVPPKKTEVEEDPAEPFYDRMHFARDVEGLLGALYRDFLTLRFDPAWEKHVIPTLEKWVRGERIDADAYRDKRDSAIKGASWKKSRASGR